MPNLTYGQVVECNHCGEKIFIKYHESLPSDWLYGIQFGHLCPECAKIFRAFATNFFNGNVTDAWRKQEQK